MTISAAKSTTKPKIEDSLLPPKIMTALSMVASGSSYDEAAEAMNMTDREDIAINVRGGGQMGQVDAIRTAIARGLVKYNDGAEGDDEELRDEFIRFERKMLVNDPRRKEPKHQMGRGARKKWQKSYR